CKALLNPDDKIVLRAESEDRKLLVGFHPQPGNYEVELPPGEEMAAGTRWDFVCPWCDRSLVSELSDALCALDVHAGGDTHRVFFSRIVGEQATFVVGGIHIGTCGLATNPGLRQRLHRHLGSRANRHRTNRDKEQQQHYQQ
ncbi:MAG: hypothetical protein ACK2U9_07620, partial [Anaerolineae bacterium]